MWSCPFFLDARNAYWDQAEDMFIDMVRHPAATAGSRAGYFGHAIRLTSSSRASTRAPKHWSVRFSTDLKRAGSTTRGSPTTALKWHYTSAAVHAGGHDPYVGRRGNRRRLGRTSFDPCADRTRPHQPERQGSEGGSRSPISNPKSDDALPWVQVKPPPCAGALFPPACSIPTILGSVPSR